MSRPTCCSPTRPSSGTSRVRRSFNRDWRSY
jgi:hypothetical protein